LISEQTLYVNKIVEDLQDYARPLNPRLEETDLEKTVHSVLSTLTVPENIKVEVAIEKPFPKLKTDQTYLQRIITNLTNNGLQAMPHGGKLAIKAVTESGKAHIIIEDTGEGIPQEAREKLFTPLFTTKAKGQGFGLAVIKRLTEALGGTVALESEVGKGTRFIVYLPL
jgi:signal transduction histidine kinase